MAKLGKFLVAATAFCLSAAPALSQDRVGVSPVPVAPTPDPHHINAAHMGDIRAREMDAYQKQMQAAMKILEPKRRDAAVIAARQQLAQSIRKPLTAATIAELDGLLDIAGVSPQLGAAG
jgi:hypothetical protein